MAIYGLDIYGAASTFYGARPAVSFSAAPFISNSPNYGQVVLNWSVPTGNYTNFRLVKNNIGYSTDPDDGMLLLDTTPAAGIPNNYTDNAVVPGKFYYYTIWVLAVSSPNTWVLAGSTTSLVSKDYGYSATLFNKLPGIFRTSTNEVTSEDGNTTLSQFLSIFGFQFDFIRNEHDTLKNLYDPAQVAAGMLPALVHQFGLPYEVSLGQRINRIIAKNATAIHKNRGTVTGIQLLVSSYTGWASSISTGRNLALDNNESSFEQSLGHWSVRSDSPVAATLSRTALVGWQDPTGNIASNAYMTVTTGATAGTVIVTSALTNMFMIPVTAGVNYTASIFTNAATTARANTINIDWYDINGVFISNAAGTGVNSTVGTWTRISTTGLAPTNAFFARANITIAGTSANEVNQLDQFQFEVGTSATAPQYARDQRITLYADRINQILDPSFEGTLSTWNSNSVALTQSTNISALYGTKVGLITGAGVTTNNLLTADASSSESNYNAYNISNASVARTTAVPAADGVASLAITATAAGDVAVGVGSSVAVIPGVYTGVASFRAASTPRMCQIQLDGANGAGYVSSYLSGQKADNSQGWQQVVFTLQIPANVTQVNPIVKVMGCAAGEVHYVDAVGLFADPTGNLLPNPDFENGLSGWGVDAGCTISISTAQAYIGRQSLLVTKTGLDAYPKNNSITPVAGTTYTASAWVRSSVALPVQIFMNYAGQSTGGTLVTLVPDTWTLVTHTSTAPANPNNLAVFPASTGGFPAATYYVDAVQVVVGNTPQPYLPPTTTNLVTNPSFEVDASGWSGPTRTTAQSYIGAASGTKTFGTGYNSIETVVYYPSAAGMTFSASAYVRADGGSPTGPDAVALSIVFQDVNGVILTESGRAYLDTLNTWKRLVVAGVAPTGTAQVRLRVFTDTATITRNVWVDAAQVELGSVATPYCLDPATVVSTEDGPRELGTVKVGDRLHGKNGFREVVNVWPVETEAYRLTFSNGVQIVASDEHRFMATRWPWDPTITGKTGWSWRTVADITPGMYVQAALDVAAPDGADEADLAYLMGYAVGDGFATSTNSRNQPHICWTFGSDYRYLADHVSALAQIALPCSIYHKAHCSVTGRDGNELFVSTHNPAAFRLFTERGFPVDCKSAKKHLPTAVWTYKRGDLLAFLAGLIDSDGSVAMDGSVQIDTVSEVLAQDVQRVLSMRLGVHASLVRNRLSGGYSSGREFTYRVRVTKADAAFLRDLGLPVAHRVKAERLAASVPSQVRRGHVKVVSVEPVGTRTLIDITLADEHDFVAEGLVTHNCDGSLGAGYSWESSENLLSAAASSFEDGTTGGWQSGGNSNLANGTVQVFSGSKSLTVTSTVTGDFSAVGGNRVSPRQPAAAGQIYTASAYVRADSTSTTSADLQLRFVNNADSAVTALIDSGFQTITNSGWTRLVVTGLAPAGADIATFDVFVTFRGSTSAGSVAYIDAVQVEQKDHATPYGSTGTPNASTSIRKTPWSLGGTPVAINPTISATGGPYTGLLPVYPNNPYSLSFYVQSSNVPKNFYAQIDWYTAGSVYISSSIGSVTTTSVGSWQRVSITNAIAPSNATQAIAILYGNNIFRNEKHYVDGALFELSSSLNPYFDGSTPINYASAGDFLWGNSAVNNAPSYQYRRRLIKDARVRALLADYVPPTATFTMLYGGAT